MSINSLDIEGMELGAAVVDCLAACGVPRAGSAQIAVATSAAAQEIGTAAAHAAAAKAHDTAAGDKAVPDDRRHRHRETASAHRVLAAHLQRGFDPSAAAGKREFSQDERDRLAGTGAAMPDGGFPIKTPKDLENAIHAVGRAKDPAAVKRHIIRRARALGLTAKLPAGWAGADKSQ